MPCLEFTGGKSQDAVILVEELAETLNFVGASEGAAIEQKSCTCHYKFKSVTNKGVRPTSKHLFAPPIFNVM